ncbi:MAG: hypothetical protein R3C49_11340 [Planctomycetaceae bacterium]
MKTQCFSSVVRVAFAVGMLISGSTVMAGGNVTAANVNGQLQITGDGNGNSIQIQPGVVLTSIGGFKFRLIAGLQVAGLDGTTVNNKVSQVFTGINGGLQVQLNGGNDSLKLGFASGVTAINGPVTVDMGAGTDRVDVLRVAIAGDARFRFGGSGDDQLIADLLDVAGNLVAESDSGNDLIFLDANAINVGVSTSGGDDQVAVVLGTIDGILSVETGAGRDEVALVDLDVIGAVIMATGFGSDTVELEDSRFGQIFVDLNGNDDSLLLDDVIVDGPAAFDGVTAQTH